MKHFELNSQTWRNFETDHETDKLAEKNWWQEKIRIKHVAKTNHMIHPFWTKKIHGFFNFINCSVQKTLVICNDSWFKKKIFIGIIDVLVDQKFCNCIKWKRHAVRSTIKPISLKRAKLTNAIFWQFKFVATCRN